MEPSNFLQTNIDQIDNIYKRYGYEVKKISNTNIRVYVFRRAMYYGADIVPLISSAPVEKIKKDFSEDGYACKVRDYRSIEEIEDTLFSGFFNTEIRASRIEKSYKDFTSRQLEYLGDSAEYTYIESPYNTYSSLPSSMQRNIIDDVLSALSVDGPVLIVIEAAAGFGKTCTAYEVLNRICLKYPKKNPLFTELSRNRSVKVFKYILLAEIEAEYHNSIHSDLVKHHIGTGRIPLIIDGFDELLSNSQEKSLGKASDFEEVETMLSTIGELLVDDAKIILTSRKTAIFSSPEFYKWLDSYEGKFNIIRFFIEKPRVKDWLPEDRIKVIEDHDLPLKHISNPVLLSYLRCLSEDKFKENVADATSLVDRYFDFLLERELIRQDLLVSPANQLVILKELAWRFAEYNITAEKRDFVKEIIIDYNSELIDTCRKLYTSTERPTRDQLADKLANHALLDRIAAKDSIGFVNDFVFGTLIGKFICESPEASSVLGIPEGIAQMVVTAYQFQNEQKRDELWSLLTADKFNHTDQFKLAVDSKLKEEIFGLYTDVTFSSMNFEDVLFSDNCIFSRCVFIECIFESCNLNKTSFLEVSFIKCTFQECVSTDIRTDKEQSVILVSCIDYSSGFLKNFKTHDSDDNVENVDYLTDTESMILRQFFKVDGKTTRFRQISLLKTGINSPDFAKIFDSLVNESYILVNGNNAHISQQGISYFFETLKRN